MATIAQRIKAEIDRANIVTGKADNTLHEAVSSLVSGYGQGGGVSLDDVEVFVTNYMTGEATASKGAISKYERKIVPA